MTKADLVDKIHAKAGLGTKAATEQFLDAAISVLSETIANGEQVSFTGFGSFKVVERSERKGRNPRVAPAAGFLHSCPQRARLLFLFPCAISLRLQCRIHVAPCP